MQRIVLLSSLLWWELGTNSLITSPGEWLSFRRFTSKLSWSWSWSWSWPEGSLHWWAYCRPIVRHPSSNVVVAINIFKRHLLWRCEADFYHISHIASIGGGNEYLCFCSNRITLAAMATYRCHCFFTNRPVTKSSQTVRWQNQMFDYRIHSESQPSASVDFLRVVQFLSYLIYYRNKFYPCMPPASVRNQNIKIMACLYYFLFFSL